MYLREFQIIKSDASIEHVTADWYRHHRDGWTFERRGMAWGEPHTVFVKRYREDRVILVTNLDQPV